MARRVASDIFRLVSSECFRPLFQGTFPRLATEILRLDSAVCLWPCRDSECKAGIMGRVEGDTGVATAMGGGGIRRPREGGVKRAWGDGMGGVTRA